MREGTIWFSTFCIIFNLDERTNIFFSVNLQWGRLCKWNRVMVSTLIPIFKAGKYLQHFKKIFLVSGTHSLTHLPSEKLPFGSSSCLLINCKCCGWRRTLSPLFEVACILVYRFHYFKTHVLLLIWHVFSEPGDTIQCHYKFGTCRFIWWYKIPSA